MTDASELQSRCELLLDALANLPALVTCSNSSIPVNGNAQMHPPCVLLAEVTATFARRIEYLHAIFIPTYFVLNQVGFIKSAIEGGRPTDTQIIAIAGAWSDTKDELFRTRRTDNDTHRNWFDFDWMEQTPRDRLTLALGVTRQLFLDIECAFKKYLPPQTDPNRASVSDLLKRITPLERGLLVKTLIASIPHPTLSASEAQLREGLIDRTALLADPEIEDSERRKTAEILRELRLGDKSSSSPTIHDVASRLSKTLEITSNSIALFRKSA